MKYEKDSGSELWRQGLTLETVEAQLLGFTNEGFFYSIRAEDRRGFSWWIDGESFPRWKNIPKDTKNS